MRLLRVYKEPTQTQGISLRKAKEERDNYDPAFRGGVTPITPSAEALLSLEGAIKSVENWIGDTDSHSGYNAYTIEHPLALNSEFWYDEVNLVSLLIDDIKHELEVIRIKLKRLETNNEYLRN